MKRSVLLGHARRYSLLDVVVGLPIGLGLFALGMGVASLPRCGQLTARRPSPRLPRKRAR